MIIVAMYNNTDGFLSLAHHRSWTTDMDLRLDFYGYSNVDRFGLMNDASVQIQMHIACLHKNGPNLAFDDIVPRFGDVVNLIEMTSYDRGITLCQDKLWSNRCGKCY